MPFNKTALFFRSVLFYRKPLLMISLGAMLTSMIITGALVIGDSVKGTLRHISQDRTGQVKKVVMSQERWFRADIAKSMQEQLSGKFAAVIMLSAYVSVPQESTGLAVNLYGIDDNFFRLSLNNQGVNLPVIKEKDVFVNTKAEQLLKANIGTDIILRVFKPGQMPQDAPLSESSGSMIARKLKVTGVINNSQFGDFQLAATQQSVPSLFLSRSYLAEIINRQERANILLTDREEAVLPVFKNTLALSDYGLEINPVGNQWELTSNRVFISDNVNSATEKISARQERIFTYFVNDIRFENKSVPYSFVAGFDKLACLENLTNDEVVINQWLADQLQCPLRATLELKAYKINRLGTLVEESFEVKVAGIIPMTDPAVDSTLMPRFPGFENTDSCSDWDPGLPIDLNRIRPEDEDYWNKYQGTPKIILPLATAQDFFANRFGNLTAIRFNKKISEEELTKQLVDNLQPDKLGFRAVDLNKQSSEGVKHAVDFSGLFIGLSFFIIVSAILLTVLLYSFYIEKLHKEYGVLNILGFHKKIILGMYLGQGIIFALIGVVPGSLAGYLYAWVVLQKLNTVWGGVVSQAHIELFVSTKSMLLGSIFSLTAVCFAVGVQAVRFIRSTGKMLVTGEISLKRIQKRKTVILTIVFFVAAVSILIYVNKTDQLSNIGLFILVGFFMLAAITQSTGLLFLKWASSMKDITIKSLALRNCSRRFDRSMAVLRLLSLAIFLTIAVGLNQQSFRSNPLEKSSGTGGFTHYIETANPITMNLNSAEDRKSLKLSGLSNDLKFIQLPTMKQSEASCLNLNRVVNPNISGVNPLDFNERFQFQKIFSGVGTGWNILNYKFEEPDVIPVVADMNVILWSLGKKLGEDLIVSDSDGKKYRLRFVGGLKNSIFQGRVLVSLQNFYKLYPDSVGTNVILFKADEKASNQVISKLTRAFSEYGLNLEKTGDRLDKFNAVQNTYLAVFLALGGIGLILGCGGLMVLIQRNIYERQAEITYLRISGYSRKNIRNLLFNEYILIFVSAVACGLIASFVAVYPSLGSIKGSMVLKNAALLIGLFIAIGAFSILAAIRGRAKINLNLLKEAEV